MWNCADKSFRLLHINTFVKCSVIVALRRLIVTKFIDLFKQFNWLISSSERQRKIGRRRLVIVPMWLTGRGELPFSFVGQESTCDWWNTWTRSKHLFFFNRGRYECVYRKSWPGPPPSCPRPALLLLEEINPGVESRDKKKKRASIPRAEYYILPQGQLHGHNEIQHPRLLPLFPLLKRL